jgi:NAD(P)-dependent dehydrogenase (short-subunit alcohol dehydrogenase family)
VINVPSSAFVLPELGRASYTATKAALEARSRAMVYELKDPGIAANCLRIEPQVWSEVFAATLPGIDTSPAGWATRQDRPAPRWDDPPQPAGQLHPARGQGQFIEVRFVEQAGAPLEPAVQRLVGEGRARARSVGQSEGRSNRERTRRAKPAC